MAQHRSHSVAFKRPVSQEYLGGETLHGLSKRHDLSRNLIRIWVEKYQAGGLDEDVAADLLQAYEARIAALERLVGRQALELELLIPVDGEADSRGFVAGLDLIRCGEPEGLPCQLRCRCARTSRPMISGGEPRLAGTRARAVVFWR